MDGSDEHRHGPKGEHEDGKDAGGTEALAQDGDGHGKQHIGNEEDADDQVVLVARHAQIVAEAGRLRIAQVALVEGVEEVHDGQGGHQTQVKLEAQTTLSGVVDDVGRLANVGVGGVNDGAAVVGLFRVHGRGFGVHGCACWAGM